VGNESHFAAVPPDRDANPVRRGARGRTAWDRTARRVFAHTRRLLSFGRSPFGQWMRP
jgi:hypothetical protein